MVNQTEVAKLAGVSFITVSRVINKKGNVKEETRMRVQEAIEKLGYYPNSHARGLSSNKVKTIGMRLQGDISNDFLSDLLSGVESVCKNNDYSLLLSFNNNASELEAYFERKVDGVILFLSNISDEDIALIEKNKIPCVILFDKINSKDVISVCIDDEKGGFLATEHLIELGHKKIALFAGDEENRCAIGRHNGYLKALKKHNIIPEDKYLFRGDFSKEAGILAANEVVAMKEKPTAIFCVGDNVAIGAMEVFRREGIRVPEDISIIGFDAGESTSHTYSPLTSMYNPVKEIGRIGSKLLLDKINGFEPENIVNDFEIQLIRRKSTMRLN